MAYIHGAYATIGSISSAVVEDCKVGIVYVGTAPVHTVPGGNSRVNVPVLCESMADARSLLGYSDDWTKYTLCEAMHAHFELNGVGPIIFINVLDPVAHADSSPKTVSLTPANGRIVIADAESIYLDSISISGKTKGTDYSAAYNSATKVLTISELSAGALGKAALSVTYNTINAASVDPTDVIGADDGLGATSGLYAVAQVYQTTGYIPSILACPGFSSTKSVHDSMYTVSKKVNGHWDMYMFADLALTNEGSPITLADAANWKKANGYNHENETVFFPAVLGTDGAVYHLSVLACANFHSVLVGNEGIPYMTASNTACPIIAGLYTGDGTTSPILDDTIINKTLNANGIASAAFVGGKWVIWGRHCADYDQSNADMLNVSETNRMMLYYLSNDFQARRTHNVDKPLTINDLRAIVSEEQARLDALVKIGALTYGVVYISAETMNRSDVFNGDYQFSFNITTTQLSKSLTAIVNWTQDGFTTYFEAFGL